MDVGKVGIFFLFNKLSAHQHTSQVDRNRFFKTFENFPQSVLIGIMSGRFRSKHLVSTSLTRVFLLQVDDLENLLKRVRLQLESRARPKRIDQLHT